METVVKHTFTSRPLGQARVALFPLVLLNFISNGATVDKQALSEMNLGAANGVIVADFQDLETQDLFQRVPDHYKDLSWAASSWFYGEFANEPGQNYAALGSSNGTIAGIDGEDFYFDGADYWSRRTADAQGDFYFVLYHDGQLVYDGREVPGGRQRFDGAPQFFQPSYTGLVDIVALVFDGGGDDWDHLAMDNFQFRRSSPLCPADLNDDGLLNFFDVSAFLNAYNAMSPAADFTGDGVYNFFDVSAFLNAYNAGCP